ncbi:Ig-like domain-containing protein [Lachnospiraceae bacterium ZAX-1]
MKSIKKTICKSMALLLALIMVVTIIPILPAEAAAKVKLNKTSSSLVVGTTLQLKLNNAKGTISWSSSKKTVAAVSSKGKVTAKKKGSATITAKFNKKSYKCKVTVVSPKLSKTSLSLGEGASQKLILNNAVGTVNWSSSNAAVATVTSDGTVTGRGAGAATITAKNGKKNYICTVTVIASYSVAEKYAAYGMTYLYRQYNPYNLTVQKIYSGPSTVYEDKRLEIVIEYTELTNGAPYPYILKVYKFANIPGTYYTIVRTPDVGTLVFGEGSGTLAFDRWPNPNTMLNVQKITQLKDKFFLDQTIKFEHNIYLQ